MPDGVMIGMDGCCRCGSVFGFDPAAVPVAVFDAVSGAQLPGDATPEQMDAGVRRPLCPSCAKDLNVIRREHGLDPIEERDTLELIARGGM